MILSNRFQALINIYKTPHLKGRPCDGLFFIYR
jgi:hypothetical protein